MSHDCSWVNYKVSTLEALHDKDDEDSKLVYQMHKCDLHDFILLSRSINTYQEENICMSPYSLSQESTLWRCFMLRHPEILDFLFYGSTLDIDHFLSFYKLFYQHYWHPDRKQWVKTPGVFKMGFNIIFAWVQNQNVVTHSMEDLTQNVREDDYNVSFENFSKQNFLKSKASDLLRMCSEEAMQEVKSNAQISVSSIINRKFRPSIAYWIVRNNGYHSKSTIAFKKFMLNVSENKSRSMAERVTRVLVFNRRSEFMENKPDGREISTMFPHIGG